MTIQLSSVTGSVIERYGPYFVRLPFANRTFIDFQGSHYNDALSDGPEANTASGILPIIPPEQGWDKLQIVTSTSHQATELTEFGVPGASGVDTAVDAEPGVISAWIPVVLTGFADDELRNAPMENKIGWVKNQFAGAFKQLGDYVNGALLGSTVKGIIGAIDDATAYGGVDPGVYTAWQSYVNKTGGVISLSILDDVWYSVTGGDRQASESDLIWLAPSNQIKRVKQMGDMLSANAEMQTVIMADGRTLELGRKNVSYNAPFVKIPDMSTTDIVLFNTLGAHIQEVRSLRVDAKNYGGDGLQYYVSWRGKLVIPNKNKSGKAEGLDA